MFVTDPGAGFFPSRIPGPKKQRILDPDQQHCVPYKIFLYVTQCCESGLLAGSRSRGQKSTGSWIPISNTVYLPYKIFFCMFRNVVNPGFSQDPHPEKSIRIREAPGSELNLKLNFVGKLIKFDIFSKKNSQLKNINSFLSKKISKKCYKVYLVILCNLTHLIRNQLKSRIRKNHSGSTTH
jgi:hypothetical protein